MAHEEKVSEILKQNKAGDGLPNSSEILSLAASLARLGPWNFNLEKHVFEFNNQFYSIYGTDVAKEGVFMTPERYLHEFVHPEDITKVEEMIQRADSFSEQEFIGEMEHRIIRRDGEARIIKAIISASKDAGGNIIKLYGANQDITERKAMENDIRSNEELVSLAADLARLAPWEYIEKIRRYKFNDSFYAIYGTDVATEGELMAPEVYIKEFVHPDDAALVKDCYEKANASRQPDYVNQVEHRIIRRDGEVRWMVSRHRAIRDEHGRVIHRFGANQDITERKLTEEAVRKKTDEIYHLAYTDALTGLANRTRLNECLQDELELASCGMSAGFVLFIDLDDLKTVNDTLGHSYGDILIAETGKRIAENIGNNAIVARIGGDEFMVIAPGITEKTAIDRIAENIIWALSQEVRINDNSFHISASAGISIYPADGQTAEEIFKNADNAMYAAKNSGKNGWRFYDAEMHKTVYEEMLLTNGLRLSIERGELSLNFQPQVTVARGEVIGFEALLRWNSYEYGSIPPSRFIPLAEKKGLIHIIGDWVLREACKFASKLADNGWLTIFVSVNISPLQLNSEDFVCKVCSILNETGVKPSQIELEITENALIESHSQSVSRLNELKAMGIRLALDDFGTGYSSLTYLQSLPTTTLKIDKNFVDTILVEGKQREIIKTIITLAHTMGMSVVAEGVEEKEQLEFLERYHCDVLQGYAICRPVSESEAIRFYQENSKNDPLLL